MRESPSSFAVHRRVTPPYHRPLGCFVPYFTLSHSVEADSKSPVLRFSLASHTSQSPTPLECFAHYFTPHTQWKARTNHSYFTSHLCHNVRNLKCFAFFLHIQQAHWNPITGHSSFISHSRYSTPDIRQQLDHFRYLSNRILDRTMNLKMYSIA